VHSARLDARVRCEKNNRRLSSYHLLNKHEDSFTTVWAVNYHGVLEYLLIKSDSIPVQDSVLPRHPQASVLNGIVAKRLSTVTHPVSSTDVSNSNPTAHEVEFWILCNIYSSS
jgi:hypothetical protein